jgi:hypothetical protein
MEQVKSMMTHTKIVGMAVGVVAICCVSISVSAQEAANKAVNKAVDDFVESIRTGQTLQLVPKDLISGSSNDVVDKAAAFQNDPLPLVRYFAAILTRDAAKSTTDGPIRQKAVSHLTTAMTDADPLVWQHAAKYLLQFSEEDFDENARALIAANVQSESPRREEIRVAGQARITALLPRLAELLIDERAVEDADYAGRWYGTVGWAARLARARMGINADSVHAIATVEAEEDAIVRVTILLRDLAYIGQPDTLRTLRSYVASDAVLPSEHPPRPGSPYHQYAIDVLAEFAEGFPFAAEGPGGYTEEDRNRVLTWLDDRLQQ